METARLGLAGVDASNEAGDAHLEQILQRSDRSA